jgi:hypothetical protein
MRVAMLAPIAWRTPPRQYGPWEQVVATLTDGLLAVGIDVTLYATGDSAIRAGVRSVVRRGYEEDSSYDVKVFEALHIARVFEDADQFDLIHNHFDFLPLMWSRLVGTPMVATIVPTPYAHGHPRSGKRFACPAPGLDLNLWSTLLDLSHAPG